MAGEIDYMQYLPFDMLPLLEKDKGVKLMGLGGIHQFQGNFRLNHAFPPFDNPAVRKVMWKLVDQDATLTAIGVPDQYRSKSCPSFWMCGTPLTTDAGASAAKVDLAAAKAELKGSGYKGEPVIILEVAGSISQTASRVLAQNMRDVGFTVEQQPRDWPTVLARRAKKDGWSMFPVYSNGTDMYSPLTHFYVAATCNDFPGWSCDNRVPDLLKAFTRAATLDERKKIAADIQVIAYELVPSLMWGQFTIPAGYRSDLKGLIQSDYPMFWEVDRDMTVDTTQPKAATNSKPSMVSPSPSIASRAIARSSRTPKCRPPTKARASAPAWCAPHSTTPASAASRSCRPAASWRHSFGAIPSTTTSADPWRHRAACAFG